MKENKLLAWTSFIFFALSAGIVLLLVIFSTGLSGFIENPGVMLLLVAAFSFIAAILGFFSFAAPPAKIGGIGGLILFLLVLFVIPVGRETNLTPPQPVDGVQERTGYSGIPEIDVIIETMLAGDRQEELQLFQFSRFPCTYAEGFGGPPKCKQGEVEGTLVESIPVLGPEGHHVRRDEMGDWLSIQASGVYAVYRVSEQVYSDEFYPAGEYAIAFLSENQEYLVTVQVTDGKIVRLDYYLGNPSELNLEQAASEIIVAPPK
jgi:hypothetical protein